MKEWPVVDNFSLSFGVDGHYISVSIAGIRVSNAGEVGGPLWSWDQVITALKSDWKAFCADKPSSKS